MSETFLHKLRIQRHISQSELARISGVNYRTLQDFEQGRKSIANAKGEMLYRLSKALGCTTELLISHSEPHIDIEIESCRKTHPHLQSYVDKISDSTALYAKHYRFPIVADCPPIDMARIYPTKQLLISKLHEKLSADHRITSVMLFGSSITMQCHRDSDTDLSVRLNSRFVNDEIKNDVSYTIQEICDFKADILWFDRLEQNERIYHDICKGVQIL